MPWNVEATPTDPEQAIAWFRARLPLPDPAYRALSEEARRRAFFVAGLAQLDMVQEALDALDAALAKGETFEQFKDRLSERIQRAWGGASAHRLRTIFDTNLQSAYGAGRWKAADELRQERPYWGLSVVLDGRTSRICLNLAGVVLPADHPFWNTHIPPLHFRCRTALVTYSAAQAEGRITQRPPDQPPLEGFGRPPGREAWSPEPRDYHPELWRAYLRTLATHPEARDRLRQLAESRGQARPEPRDWLVAAGQVYAAPFNRRERLLGPEQAALLGKSRASSLEAHLATRILEEQVLPTTTPEEYERVCREVAAHPEVAVLAFARAQGPVLAVMVPTSALPDSVRGPRVGRFWFVVYSFHSSTLATGYGVSALEKLNVPWQETTWLRRPPWLTVPSN
ncbi:phage minor head protein [Meiothermus cerbereus]|uniref:phage head morphogenesis protein n=1 Tax=Meiothermus cerbereus TaxID=65552 RepID=UPI000683EAF0|nr:phage minor head protein [Meiothermus cerbereus]